MNVGGEPVRSRSGTGDQRGLVHLGGKTTYALEGSVFNAGSSIQWLRDELKLIDSARSATCWPRACRTAAACIWCPPSRGWARRTGTCTPGAPSWADPGQHRAHIARAVLDSIAYQVTDLMNAMREDAARPITTLRVDGGASVSDILLQTQADLLRTPVDRPAQVETTAFGAAALAGLAAGVWSGIRRS
jgi:glycerol kinase